MKRKAALLLAVLLAVTLRLPAIADDSQTSSGGSGVEIPLNGAVKEDAKLISVSMPVSIDFAITTREEEETMVFNGLVSAYGEFTNNSNCDVTLSVESVTDNNGLLTHVDLALAPSSLKTGTDARTIFAPPYLLTTETAGNTLGTINMGNTLRLKLFGRDKAEDDGSLADGSYTVLTVMKVTAAE